MKKKIFALIGTALFVGAMAFNLSLQHTNNNFSETTIKNLEALAGSSSEGYGDCWITLACTSGNKKCTLNPKLGSHWYNHRYNRCY